MTTAPTIAVLDAVATDAAIPDLTAILRDCVANGASVGFMKENTGADYERYWRDVIAGVTSGQIILLGAGTSQGLVGTAQLHLIGKPNQPHRAEIAKVLVHSRARRQGLGEALMREAEGIAREKGRDLLVLDTDENGEARRLYVRLGWTELGTIPRFALKPDGAFCGSTFFYKSLA